MCFITFVVSYKNVFLSVTCKIHAIGSQTNFIRFSAILLSGEATLQTLAQFYLIVWKNFEKITNDFEMSVCIHWNETLKVLGSVV